MAILPVQAATQLLQIAAAGKVAVSAASAASATFADLLQARDAKTNLHGGDTPNSIAAAVNSPNRFLNDETTEFDLYVDRRRTQVSFL